MLIFSDVENVSQETLYVSLGSEVKTGENFLGIFFFRGKFEVTEN